MRVVIVHLSHQLLKDLLLPSTGITEPLDLLVELMVEHETFPDVIEAPVAKIISIRRTMREA